MTSAADMREGAVNEQVVYQNPLLFLKIWELQSVGGPRQAADPWHWHYHKEVEFLAIIEGGLEVQTMTSLTQLGPGDVMVVGSSRPHRTWCTGGKPVRYLVFQVDLVRHFDQSILPYLHHFSELKRPLEDLNYIFQESDRARNEAYALIGDIYEETHKGEAGYEIAVSASIKRLLLLLLRGDDRGLLRGTEEAGVARLRPVLDYVDSRLGERIAVDDVRRLLGMSYHHFIKTFKRTMGIPFVDYVNYNRIKKAERLLLTTDLSIMEVSFEVGIWNMAQFYKLFKRHNQHSPKEFRQRMRN